MISQFFMHWITGLVAFMKRACNIHLLVPEKWSDSPSASLVGGSLSFFLSFLGLQHQSANSVCASSWTACRMCHSLAVNLVPPFCCVSLNDSRRRRVPKSIPPFLIISMVAFHIEILSKSRSSFTWGRMNTKKFKNPWRGEKKLAKSHMAFPTLPDGTTRKMIVNIQVKKYAET